MAGHTSWFRNKKLRSIAIMLLFMTVYSIGEIAVSLMYMSLTMFSDGLHNLSDGLALVVAFWAERKKLEEGSNSMTYGWRRTELLGGLFNGLFLLVVALFVCLQAIPKFIDPEEAPNDGLIFIIVAGTGIVFNVAGTFLFAGHGHGHSHGGGGGGGGGGHGHSHGNGKAHGHSHSHSHALAPQISINTSPPSPSSDNMSPSTPLLLPGDPLTPSPDTARDHNMWGLFAHFLGDVFTSLLVLGVGLIYYLKPPPHPLPEGAHTSDYWANYADPVSSILSVVIIVLSAWPVVKSCSWILLQTSPASVDIQATTDDILKVPSVVGVHELHVWQLVDSLVIGTVHIVVSENCDWSTVVAHVKRVLHKHGIHSSTVQPEFDGVDVATEAANCIDPCVQSCSAEKQCCPKRNTTADEVPELGMFSI